MLKSAALYFLYLTLTLTAASPHEKHPDSPYHPNHPHRSKVCTIASSYKSSNGTYNDAPAVAEAFASCARDAVIVFSEGVDYNIFTPISAKNLSNVEIRMEGNIHLPKNITYVQNIVNTSNALTYSTALYWFTFSGPSIDYISTGNVTTGWINSYGQSVTHLLYNLVFKIREFF
jgi:hypothetical protein